MKKKLIITEAQYKRLKSKLNEGLSLSEGGNDLEFLYKQFKEGMLNAKKNKMSASDEQHAMYYQGIYDALSGVVSKMFEYVYDDSHAGDAIGPGEHGDVDGKF